MRLVMSGRIHSAYQSNQSHRISLWARTFTMKGLTLYTLLLCAYCIYYSKATLTKLPDGIRVYRGPATRIVKGTWTLLITIREPGEEYRSNERRSLLRDVNILLDVVRRENETLTLTPKRRKVMLRRLNLITLDHDLHYHIDTATRRKRGLIDAGGWLLNKVFGTATEQQIEDVKHQLNDAARQRGAVVHNTERLITIVNQTRLEATATRAQLTRLGAAHGQFVTDELARWTSFHVVTRYNLLHDMMETLCDLDEGLNREILAINNLHTTIRQGRVTEGICPISLISEVNRLAHAHGLVPLPMEWYYQNLDITPLLVQDGTITYKIEIPYVDDAVYERYTIETYAVPINESGTTARVIVRPDIAVHTTEAYWFVPQKCTGWRPQLCHTGALFKEPTFNCERGLLTGYTKDTTVCSLEKGFITATTIQDIGDGSYVIITLGDEYTRSCRGEHQQRHSLTMGTYFIQLGDECVITGTTWRLMGEIRQFINVSADQMKMTVPVLDLDDLMPPDWQDNMNMNNITQYIPWNNDFNDFSNLNDDAMNDLLNDLMNNMESMNNDGYNEKWIGHNIAWGSLGIVCCVGLVLIVGGRYAYLKRKKIRYFLDDAKKPVKPPRSGISQDRLTEEIEMT